MATISTLLNTDDGATSLGEMNTNFSNLNSAKIEGPATNTNNNIPQWDGANSKLLKDGKAAPSGAIVGDTDTQTLTNKTLTSPKINEAVALTTTATELNLLHNNLGAYLTSWTPSFTNLSIGNGTVAGRYIEIGKYTTFSVILTFGTTTSISGSVSLILPTTKQAAYPNAHIGFCRLLRQGVGYYIGKLVGDGTIQVDTVATSYIKETPVNATVPATWASTDIWYITGFYETT